MILRTFVVSSVVAICVASISCAVPAKTPSHPGEVEEMCHSSCMQRQRCGGPGNEPSCESYCAEHGTKWRAYYRKDYVDAVSQCFDTLQCSAARDERQRRSSCFDATRPEPNEKAKETCNAIIDRIRDCGHFLSKEPYDTNRCLRTVGLLDDSTLDAIKECTSLQCMTARKYSPWDCMRDVAGADTMP